MRVHASSGGRALRAFEEARAPFLAEPGVEPDDETRRLREEIARGT